MRHGLAALLATSFGLVAGGRTEYEYRKSARLELVFVAHNKNEVGLSKNGDYKQTLISILYREVSNNRCTDANDGTCYTSQLTPCPVSVCPWRKEVFRATDDSDSPLISVRDLTLCSEAAPYALWWTQTESDFNPGDGDGGVYYQRFTMQWSQSKQWWQFVVQGVTTRAYPPESPPYADRRGQHQPWGLSCYRGFSHAKSGQNDYNVYFNDRQKGKIFAISGNLSRSVYEIGPLAWQEPTTSARSVASSDLGAWYRRNPSTDGYGMGSNTGVFGADGVFWTKTETSHLASGLHNKDAMPTSTQYGPTFGSIWWGPTTDALGEYDAAKFEGERVRVYPNSTLTDPHGVPGGIYDVAYGRDFSSTEKGRIWFTTCGEGVSELGWDVERRSANASAVRMLPLNTSTTADAGPPRVCYVAFDESMPSTEIAATRKLWFTDTKGGGLYAIDDPEACSVENCSAVRVAWGGGEWDLHQPGGVAAQTLHVLSAAARPSASSWAARGLAVLALAHVLHL